VPSLGAQEAIGIGEGLPLVARITFNTLPREAIPRSESGARGEGELSLERSEIVRSAIERWRRATTSPSLRVDETAAPGVGHLPPAEPAPAPPPNPAVNGQSLLRPQPDPGPSILRR
jgi:hypothetical protein